MVLDTRVPYRVITSRFIIDFALAHRSFICGWYRSQQRVLPHVLRSVICFFSPPYYMYRSLDFGIPTMSHGGTAVNSLWLRFFVFRVFIDSRLRLVHM
ncbi:uncharacterized protein EI90DRAFT_3086232 [Cantharellus anzutake]|uniref:uncharacterized protein n=1 Tax=Cantharellus anzutake TaxID=1750568 RepID=UPI00190558E5|nr:uncharacterized protein EI90DRAFT_3086232 [Cantharellus anzutake]KAF8316455.1 hypothetical protein EI90DRAFT_3086232 [Cantharellus anzutake]